MSGDGESSYRSLWDFKRKAHLNHGSFGATPRAILEKQAEFVRTFNLFREDMLWRQGFDKLKDVRHAVAAFVGVDTDDVVIVDNATDGFNAVLKSVPLGAGDEVLITSHAYSNYPPVFHEEAARRGFTIVVAEIPYPPESPQQIIDTILAKAGTKTKLAFIDHITSPTALIFPVKEIVAALQAQGIDTFVDGAHAPGQIPLDVKDIGAAYYTGNHHKWMCAPVASAFLYVRKDRQDCIMPAVGSGGASREAPFTERFAWTGTKDISAWACVPETIAYMASLHPDGWTGIMARNHALAVKARDLLCDRLGIIPPCEEAMFGSMFTLPLGSLQFDPETEQKAPILRLYELVEARAGFGVYALPFGDQYLLRVSCHLYNEEKDYELLAEAMAEIVREYEIQRPAASSLA
ncbi:MAG: aminotransferase class V-fold PLP-dependent enzyme [Rhodospirillales bacterium]|nr:aminotransferase class V-fold PLP-dependent enzyme [Rhodospirillales bacterium]MCB9995539.1 aminotransferase class V-fold PLP-dependent enzyme [Rhodospirillales bacterium]